MTDPVAATGAAPRPDAPPATRAHKRPEPLGRNRDFAALLGSQAVSALGDAVSFTALPLLVLALTGSGFMMGVVAALQTLPDLVVGLVAGAIADRSDRKRLMLLADLGRAVLTALIPISVLLDGPTLVILLLVVAPLSTLRSFFLAGYTASVPSIVGREQLARANAIFEAVYSFGYILGPALAGILSATIGPGLTLALDAVSFAASGLGILLIRRDIQAPSGRPPARLRDDIREGIEYLVRHPLLRAAVAYWGLTSILTAPLVPALAYHITRELGLGEDAVGFVLTAYGVGTVTGALVVARLRRVASGVLLLVGNAGTCLAILGASLAGSLGPLLGAAFLGGISGSTVLVTYITLRTAHSPDELLGRIGSTARVVSLGLQPLGLLTGGILIDAIGGGVTLALIGGAVGLVALLFAPVRALRTASLGR